MEDDVRPADPGDAAPEGEGLTGELERLESREAGPGDSGAAPMADNSAEPAPSGPDAGDAEHQDAAETSLLPPVADQPATPQHAPEAQVPVSDPTDAPELGTASATAPGTTDMTDAEAAALAAASMPAAGGVVDLAPAALPAQAQVDVGTPKNVDMGPEERSRWWLWLLIGLLVLAVVGALGYAWWWSTSRPVSVPDVVGKQAGEAAQIFNDVGLRLGDVSEVATDAAPVGIILSQEPEAGTPLKPGDRVSFAVALPPTDTEVPEVTGKLSEDAQTEVAKARLRPVVVESFASTVAAGYVVSQLPSTGLELTPGSPVVLVVSTGPVPSTVGVPRVTGLLEADVNKLVAAYNLKPLTYRAYDASIAAGTALLQSPANGTAAPYQSYVQVLISQGAGVGGVIVPTVTGQSRASAAKEVKDKGLKSEARTIPHATVPKGQVVYQMPPAGRKAATGSVVGLLISRGNTADATVPSLVGTLSAAAPTAITKAGFEPTVVTVPVNQFPVGAVFMQFPPAGTALTRGLPVVCLVAAAAPTSTPTTPTVGATPTPNLTPTQTTPGLPATPATPGMPATSPFPPIP